MGETRMNAKTNLTVGRASARHRLKRRAETRPTALCLWVRQVLAILVLATFAPQTLSAQTQDEALSTINSACTDSSLAHEEKVDQLTNGGWTILEQLEEVDGLAGSAATFLKFYPKNPETAQQLLKTERRQVVFAFNAKMPGFTETWLQSQDLSWLLQILTMPETTGRSDWRCLGQSNRVLQGTIPGPKMAKAGDAEFARSRVGNSSIVQLSMPLQSAAKEYWSYKLLIAVVDESLFPESSAGAGQSLRTIVNYQISRTSLE
ncbi:MAG: hypothetical protein QNJ13_17495 [Paracoccaceae bacterium]|nr:hypothetical protein [Paracoccaceae bacterium]